MPILESAAISGIISQVLSMSTNLTERISDRKDLSTLRELQKLVLKLQTRYTVLQDQNFELKEKLLSLKSKLDITRKTFDDHSQYETVASKDGDVYLKHKTTSNLFSCASCFGEKQKIIPLQPSDPFKTGSHLMRMCPICQTTIITVDP